ncbi:unnamed protein product [Acanthoscelides obtectus]|uniref:Uncharacterized protein n=1 Tax=Acanthoscelides obtectus TaxID=200917 RepID=A0A9P0L7M6_ACAOB|nr:unnamed protein product [Acanthoscelides obtectus]CAK1666443.1 hypothetical protein AOBTE_LOCUS25333 [Acanthoscelides obtectus]
MLLTFEAFPLSVLHNDECDDNTDAKSDSLETIDDTPEKAHGFICRIVENASRSSFRMGLVCIPSFVYSSCSIPTKEKIYIILPKATLRYVDGHTGSTGPESDVA